MKDDGTAEQLRFCGKVLDHLARKQHQTISIPFAEPVGESQQRYSYDPRFNISVDWVKLEIPNYPKVVKKPMDLLTMRRKLESHQYPTAQKFFEDFKLMIRNCFIFNPAGTPVNQAGIELQRIFDEKWKQLPPLRDAMSDDDEDDEEDDSEDDRMRAYTLFFVMRRLMDSLLGSIAEMESKLAALKSQIKPKEEKKKKQHQQRVKPEKPPVASSSKAATKPTKVAKKKPGNSSKKLIAENDVLTFEQKKDLSESIARLDETKLEKVIAIIHEGVPEIRDVSNQLACLVHPLLMFRTEYGGDRAGDRSVAPISSDKVVQLRSSTFTRPGDEAKPDWEGHWHRWPETKEHGRGR